MRPEIEAYLNGELHGKDLERFRKELDHDPALREEVELMRPAWRELRLAAIERRVRDAEHRRVKRKRARRMLILSCSLLLGVGILAWYWWRERIELEKNTPPLKIESPSPAETPELPVSPPAGPSVTAPTTQPIAEGPPPAQRPLYRSFPGAEQLPPEAVALADSFLQSFNAITFLNMEGFNVIWRKKNYAAYYRAVEESMAEKGEIDAGLLVQAASLLFLHRPHAAEPALYRMRNAGGRIGQEAQWLLALAYVMQGKDDSARAALEGIAGDVGHPHETEAGNLLGQLKE